MSHTIVPIFAAMRSLAITGLCLTLTTAALGAGCKDEPPPGETTPDAGPEAGEAGTDAGHEPKPEPQADGVWEQAFDTTEAPALFGVWGSGPHDVFIVGGTETTASIYHYDGGDWQPMEAPPVAALIWSIGFGPDDVFAVGLRGAVVHYDGRSWSVLDSGTEDDLWGIFGFERDDLWLVGGDPFGEEPTILHYDGQQFERHSVDPEHNAHGARALFKVFGIGERLFAVGSRGQAFEYRDGIWQNSPTGAAANQDFVSLWGTAEDDLVLVGGRANARIATFDGSGWNTRAEPGLGGLNAVHMPRRGLAVIGGVEGFVGRYEVGEDRIVAEEQDVTDLDVHAVWGDGQGKHYAVAGDFFPPYAGAALVRTEQAP